MEITRVPVEGYEEVYRAHDPRCGLTAFIAVHDTTLGPALGGCRMWHYSYEDDAMTDVLGLDRERTRAWTLGRLLQNAIWEVEEGRTLEPSDLEIARRLKGV